MPFPVGYSGIYNKFFSVVQHFKIGPLQQAIQMIASPQMSFGVRLSRILDKRTPKDVCGEAIQMVLLLSSMMVLYHVNG